MTDHEDAVMKMVCGASAGDHRRLGSVLSAAAQAMRNGMQMPELGLREEAFYRRASYRWELNNVVIVNSNNRTTVGAS